MNVLARATDMTRSGVHALAHYENPVVTKELRTRMRGGRSHLMMLSYVLVLSIVMFFVYYDVWVSSMGASGGGSWTQQRVGFRMFLYLTWTQMVLLALTGPSLTAGALTLELEQQTMEMLTLTNMSPRNIIMGKALSGTTFLWMLLGSSLPLAGLCLVFGGISPLEIIVTYVLLAVWAFLFSSAGVFWSSLVSKTSLASLLTFSSAAGYAIFTAVYGIQDFYRGMGGTANTFALSTLNPAAAAYKVLAVGHVFSMPVPMALIAIVINTVLGTLLLTVAQTHLKYHRPDKALAVRLQLLGLSVFTLLVAYGSMPATTHWGTMTVRAHDYAVSFLTIVMVILFVMTPAFVTGVIRCGSGAEFARYLLSGFRFKKIFSQNLSGGLPFLLIWTVVLAIAGLIPILATSYDQTAVHFLQVMISVAAVIVAYSAFGMLCSTFAGNRNTAIALTLILITASFIFYPVLSSNYGFDPQPDRMRYELAYLWPALPLQAMMDDFRIDTGGPNLAIPPELRWLAVSLCYLILGYIFLRLAASFNGRFKGVSDD